MIIIDDKKYLSNKEIYQGLLNEDEYILNMLFYGEQFNKVIGHIRGHIFKNMEFNSTKSMVFNDLYELFRKDSSILREYEKEGGDIVIWLARTAIKYYQKKRHNEKRTEKRHKELLDKHKEKVSHIINEEDVIIDPEQDLENKQLTEFIEFVISKMENPNYAEIMRKHFLDNGLSFYNIDSSNISQDKKRAMNAFLKLYFTLRKKIII